MITETITSEIDREVRRRFIKSFIHTIILDFLVESEMSGYDLRGAVYKKFNIVMSPGSIYPTLDSLESKGLIRPDKKTARKKKYTITKEGFLYLDAAIESYDRSYSLFKSYAGHILEG